MTRLKADLWRSLSVAVAVVVILVAPAKVATVISRIVNADYTSWDTDKLMGFGLGALAALVIITLMHVSRERS